MSNVKQTSDTKLHVSFVRQRSHWPVVPARDMNGFRTLRGIPKAFLLYQYFVTVGWISGQHKIYTHIVGNLYEAETSIGPKKLCESHSWQLLECTLIPDLLVLTKNRFVESVWVGASVSRSFLCVPGSLFPLSFNLVRGDLGMSHVFNWNVWRHNIASLLF